METLLQGVVSVTLLVLIPTFVLGWQGGMAAWSRFAIGCVALVVTRWFGIRVLRLLSHDNWTMGLASDGVWLNLRSVHNRTFEPAATVVYLPFSDIRSARQEITQRTTETADSVYTWTEVTLQLSVSTATADAIRQLVAHERQRRFERRTLVGITIRGRENHVPVMVDRDDNVVVYWKSRFGRLTPSISQVMQLMALQLPIQDTPPSQQIDWRELSDQQLDSYLLYLVEANDRLEAIKILVRRKGYSTTEAKRFVDELNTQLPAV